MGKLLKGLAAVIGGLLLLLVIAIVVLPMVVDPNDHKDRLLELVKQQTGRELVIRDRLELSVFPNLGITTGGVSLSNAAGFGDDPFARIEALDLRVKLMPLFSKQLEVDTLVLDGLTLNLAKDQQGRNNWQDLAGEAKGEEKSRPEDGAGKAFAFNLSGVQVKQANLVWDDRQADQRYVLKDVSLNTGAISPGSKVPLELAFALTSEKPRLKMAFGLNATLGVSNDLKVIDLPDLRVQLQAEGEGLPSGGLDMTLATALNIDQGKDTLSARNIKVSGAGVSLTGAFEGRQLSTKPAFDGKVNLADTNLRNLMALFGAAPETTDPEALKRFSGDMTIAATDSSLSIKPLKVKLDDSQLSGSFAMPSFKGPSIRFALDLDRIDLDRYLPPAGEKEAKEATASEDPLAALRGLDLDGSLSIGELKLKNMKMEKVQVKMNARGGVLKIAPTQASLYQGRYEGSLTVDARNKTPQIHAVEQLTGVQIAPLLKDLADSERLSGTGEFHADVRLAGLTEAEMRRSLNGTTRFEFRDGAVKGINIAQAIRKAKAGLGRGEVGADQTQQTDFSSITGSATITDGVLVNNDLKGLSPLLRVTGEGKVDLPADNMDYLVTTTLVRSLEGQGAQEDELTGLPIPVRLSGPLAKPSYSIDLKAVLASKAKQKVQERLEEKLLGKPPAEADGSTDGGGRLGDRLRGLLQR